MDRRHFVGSVIVGGASLFLPRKSEAGIGRLPAGIADDDQPQWVRHSGDPMYEWWQESSFMFEGKRWTEYLWPVDRLIHLEPAEYEIDNYVSIMVPPFFIWEHDADLKSYLRDMAKTGNKFNHLIRYMDDPDNHIGIVSDDKKLVPITDCCKHAAYEAKRRKDKRAAEVVELQRQKARRKANAESIAHGFRDYELIR